MNVDKIMEEFGKKAQELREKHEGETDPAALLWDLNHWLRLKLNEENGK